jgi:superfamily I DNA and/or RNA helicase
METFFVKNLENVQGDERDVIFISTTYGPDARGNQYQRFGPINGAGGHRRLNVLFTRAKKRVVVFSSLDPDRIQPADLQDRVEG